MMRSFKNLITTFLLILLASVSVNAQEIFAVTNYGDIHLIDISTCHCKFVMKVSQVTTFDDIAWQGNRLYGLLQEGGTVPGRIFVLDTSTASTSQIGSAIEYSGNAMTSDRNGNLYLVHNCGSGSGNLYRYNIASGTHVLLGNVSETVGYLAFMNDTLYAVCFMGVLKRIILNPFSMSVVGTISLPISSPYLYGLATIEDGTGLCISAIGQGMTGPMLYRLDHTNAAGTVLCASLGLPYDHMINGLAYPPTYDGPVIGMEGKQQWSALTVYPNPVIDNMMVTLPSGADGNQLISVVSVYGTEVIRHEVSNQQYVTLSAGHLPDGIYILRIQGAGMLMSGMFVKKAI